MNDNSTSTALTMLRDRGIDDAESFLNSTDPQTIIRTCKWFDREKNASKRLLAWKLKQGGVAEEDAPVNKQARMRDIFDRYLQQHPIGSRLCSHVQLSARKWPDDKETCPGQMLVVEASYPVLEMECDVCGLDAALTPRAMRGRV